MILPADDEIVKVDVETGRSVPRAYQMEAADQRYFKEYFAVYRRRAGCASART